jgi:hypothetical protein
MSDDRNAGGVPPAPEPAAPPPLAAVPPPVVPPQPVPQPVPQPYPAPAYPPAAGGSKTGMWVFFLILAFAAGVGATILTLWLTGDLWNSRSSYYPPSSYGSSSGSGTSSFGSSPSTGTPAAPSTGGYAPTEMTIVGTWGEGCPASRAGAITFYSDHTIVGDNGQGSWSLTGYYVTATTDRGTNSLYWEMISGSQARVRRAGSSSSRLISRCP